MAIELCGVLDGAHINITKPTAPCKAPYILLGALQGARKDFNNPKLGLCPSLSDIHKKRFGQSAVNVCVPKSGVYEGVHTKDPYPR